MIAFNQVSQLSEMDLPGATLHNVGLHSVASLCVRSREVECKKRSLANSARLM